MFKALRSLEDFLGTLKLGTHQGILTSIHLHTLQLTLM